MLLFLLLLLRLELDFLGIYAKDVRGLVHGGEDLLSELFLVEGVNGAVCVELGLLPPLELGALEAVHGHKEEEDGGDDGDDSWDDKLMFYGQAKVSREQESVSLVARKLV